MTAGLNTDLLDEARHLETSRAALHAMRVKTESLLTADVAGDPFSAEAVARVLRERMEQLLDDGTTPLFFGRIDHDGSGQYAGETYYIGRRHVADSAGDPMVVDWRAPVSRAFYQASAGDPMDLLRRRRFGFDGGRLTAFEDEAIARGESTGVSSQILADEIERPRAGPMRDIVSTIQPDQDVLVRAELEDDICIQGAPGTGKTAVGLHRAAYLLFAYRERLRRSGVLVVGPNRAFLSYIAQVLPALGEVNVRQSTADDLVRGMVVVRSVDTTEAARVKGDARMAQVLQRALAAGISQPVQSLVVPAGGVRLRVGLGELGDLLDDVISEDLPYTSGRSRFGLRVADRLRRQLEQRGESPPDGWVDKLARSRPVQAFVESVWPTTTAPALVCAVLSDPAILALAADGLLSETEQAAIGWPSAPRSVRAARWSVADTVLLDEAAGLLARPATFGHVIVDEAQDLSPMQCRSIGRRSVYGSVTVLGDLAQGTAVSATDSWASTLAHLGKPGARIVPLTTGYRVPAEIVELANRLLPRLADVSPAVSVRRATGSLVIVEAAALVAAVVEAVGSLRAVEGSIAVIAADAAVNALAHAFGPNAVVLGDEPSVDTGQARVTIVPASLAKGLEFDQVVVVEPSDIVDAEPRGLHRLYVVLTRAVSRLVVVHSQGLPEVLTGDVR